MSGRRLVRPLLLTVSGLALASLVALSPPGVADGRAVTRSDRSAVDRARYDAEMVRFAGQERRVRRLPALARDGCLDRYADRQARSMAAAGRPFHQDLTLVLAGCGLWEVGENVGFGYPDGRAVTTAWLRSPEHRANLLLPGHRLLGVGARQDRYGRWYVSQVLGSAVPGDSSVSHG